MNVEDIKKMNLRRGEKIAYLSPIVPVVGTATVAADCLYGIKAPPRNGSAWKTLNGYRIINLDPNPDSGDALAMVPDEGTGHRDLHQAQPTAILRRASWFEAIVRAEETEAVAALEARAAMYREEITRQLLAGGWD